MPVVTVKIFGQGNVRVSSKLPSQTAYTELGIASGPETDFSFGFWDDALFSASSEPRWQFDKFCADSNKDGKVTCGTNSVLVTTVEIPHDELLAYFKPLPPPPQPANPFQWLWDMLFGWMR